MIGIYYLVDFTDVGVEVLYIGQSRNVQRRVNQHFTEQDVLFCGVFVDECPIDALREREAAAIAEFHPRLNEQGHKMA